MKRKKKSVTVFKLGSAVFMVITLLWLTVSTPFVVAAQQLFYQQDELANAQNPNSNEEESSNPLGSNAEGKASVNSTSFSEEYLHEHHVIHHFPPTALQHYQSVNAGTYTAYHGELLVPPPNVA